MAEIFAPLQKIGLYRQSKVSNHWDAEAVFSDNFIRLNYDAGVSNLNRGISKSEINSSSRASLMQEKDRIIVEANSQLKSLNFSSEASYKLLALHLAHNIQGVTEAGTTPFLKTFIPPFFGSDPFLDITNNEGYLASLGIQNYGAGSENDSFILSNAVLDQLELVIDLMGEGSTRFMKLNGTWVGTKAKPNAQTNAGFTGTWPDKITDGFFNTDANSILGLNLYSPASDAISYTGCMRRFTFRSNLGAFSDCKTLYPSNLKFAPKYSAVIDLPFVPGLTTQIKKKFHNGDYFAFQMLTKALTTASAGYLAIKVGDHSDSRYNFILNDEPDYYEGEYVALRLSGDIVFDPANSGDASNPFQIELVDAIDGAY